MLVTSSNDPAL